MIYHTRRRRSGGPDTTGPIIWSEATPSIHFWKKTNSYACAEVTTTSKRARSTPLISELESRPDYLQRFFGSEAAQEQTKVNSIAEGSAAAQQGPQGPHQPLNFCKSFRRKGETRIFKKVWFEQWLCRHGSTTRRLQVLFSVFCS